MLDRGMVPGIVLGSAVGILWKDFFVSRMLT